LAGLAALATLIGLVSAEETWRGKWAWNKYKRELEAKGEKLDWKDYIPPPVPDDQNFAMTPFLAPLFDFNPRGGLPRWRDTNGFDRAISLGRDLAILEADITERNDPYRISLRMPDLQSWALCLSGKTNQTLGASSAMTRGEAAAVVLRALAKYDPVLDELRNASRRPYARFNIRYDEESALAILLPHLQVLKCGCSIFALRASAELVLGQTDAAWADIRMAFYLADVLQNDPCLISRLVQAATVQIALHPVWEGLAEHRWSDAQLADIEQRLVRIDLLAGASLRDERAFDLLVVDQSRQHGWIDPEDSSPVLGRAAFLLGGFYYQNRLFLARMFQEHFVPVADAASQRVYPSRALPNEAALMAGGFKPYRVFARILLPEIVSAQSKFAFGQTRVNEAIVACALERYRLANGQYPDTLEPLCPSFLEKMPHDLITGTPLKYHRTPDGQFTLYSVGWNEKDDGGTVALTQDRKPTMDLTQGDWVWQYPARAEKSAKE
jgi:hypothetical protein